MPPTIIVNEASRSELQYSGAWQPPPRRFPERPHVIGMSLGAATNCTPSLSVTSTSSGHDYFRPFSCKGFYLCPSCSQMRTILFAEHLTNEVLLDLSHRQFGFALPKALRPVLPS